MYMKKIGNAGHIPANRLRSSVSKTMPRDQVLKKVFEVADDGMQGVVGYFFYVAICQHLAKEQIIIDYLPKVPVPKNDSIEIRFGMQMFHQWIRYYDPEDLVQTMRSVFTPYHIRTCLVGIISIFEAYLADSIDRLIGKGKISSSTRARSYKGRLEWAFQIILNSKYGNAAMQNRRANLCLDIDHARRIRNLWMHNNGNFNRRYEDDAIMIPNHNPIIVPEYQRFKNSQNSKVPFPVDTDLFDTISRSHIESLHHIHNMLQVQYFAQKREYVYMREKKKIEWGRVFLGI
jgi:hypothetical protein